MSPLQWAAAVVLIVLMPIALVIATEVGRSPFEPGEAATELAALEAKLGYPPHAVSVELQNPATPQTTDEYRIEHIQALHGLIDWNRIIGPDPIQSNRPGPSVPQRVFDLNPSDFTQVPRIARAAVDRVALQEPATATAMVLTSRPCSPSCGSDRLAGRSPSRAPMRPRRPLSTPPASRPVSISAERSAPGRLTFTRADRRCSTSRMPSPPGMTARSGSIASWCTGPRSASIL
jgi:hypothetical protein